MGSCWLVGGWPTPLAGDWRLLVGGWLAYTTSWLWAGDGWWLAVGWPTPLAGDGRVMVGGWLAYTTSW